MDDQRGALVRGLRALLGICRPRPAPGPLDGSGRWFHDLKKHLSRPQELRSRDHPASRTQLYMRCSPAKGKVIYWLFCTLLCSGEAFQFAPAVELARPAGRHVCLARGLRLPRARPSVTAVSMVWLDGWIAAAKYRETCPPQSCVEQLLLDQIRKQDFDPSVLHWAHPTTMLLLVVPSMAYATYLGWKIRSSEGWALGSRQRRSAGSTHAVLMSAAALFSVFGVQGGLGSMLLADQPILESPHAATGFAFTLLLGLQGGIASQMGSNKILRSAHAFLGSALVSIFILHAGLGVGLGSSFSHPSAYEETIDEPQESDEEQAKPNGQVVMVQGTLITVQGGRELRR